MPIPDDENKKFNEALRNIRSHFADNDPESTTTPASAEDIAECLAMIWKRLGGEPIRVDSCWYR